MSAPANEPGGDRVRRTLIRVMGVQVITLVLLWILQQHFGH
jgi:hypothetical protein